MDKEIVGFSSILENDFYKFTMQHAVVNLFPKAKAGYEFIKLWKNTSFQWLC